MASDQERRNGGRRQSDIEIDGPFGTHVRFYGKELVTVIAFLLIAGGLGYLIFQHSKESHDAQTLLSQNQQLLNQHMDEMIWILSLPEKERERLNVAMPESLRSKLGLGMEKFNK